MLARVDAQPLTPDVDIALIMPCTCFLTYSPWKLLSLVTIRTVSNHWFDEYVVVVWIVSGMKKLLYFPKQLLPVAIYQSVCTYLQIL